MVAGALLTAAGLSAAGYAWPDRLSPLARGWCERATLMAADGNWLGVIDQIRHLDTQGAHLTPSESAECSYLLAQALYETGDPECVRLLRDFARENPASPLSLPAQLAEGDYYFFGHDYARALDVYSDIDYSRLDRTQLPLYTYRRALSRINRGLVEETRADLEWLRGQQDYRQAAVYYLGYLDYRAGDYDSAYELFSSAAGDDSGSVRPSAGRRAGRGRSPQVMPRLGEYESDGLEPGYYMAQIEFARGDYADAIDHARSLLARRPVAELAPEMHRVLGLSYFKQDEYSVARNFLETYIDEAGESAADDARYALAVIDYKDGNLAPATEAFGQLATKENDLGQSAWLYLGQSAAAQGDLNTAAMSFDRAMRMNFDPSVGETAQYNYITSRLEGGNIPFSSTVEMLENFLQRYPDSSYAPDIQESLATAYYNERDYRRALESIERIKKPTQSVLGARQKVLFELGCEEVANGQAAQAVPHLTEASHMTNDPGLAADAALWLGDAYYALGEWGDAERAYSRSLSGQGAGANRALAMYGLGYALYRQEQFKAAARELRDAAGASGCPVALRDDALVRAADCLYYTGDYRGATELYSAAIRDGAAASDYATFRRAVMYGHAGDTDRKIRELHTVAQKWPESKWIPDALLEIGETHAALGQTAKAAEAFRELNSSYSKTPQNRQGTLDMAIAYLKAGDSRAAEEAYRTVITTWPTSQEAALANEDMRRLAAAKGELPAYAAFLEGIPGAPRLDRDEMEQLAFDAAEQAIAADASATLGLERYVEQYPDGQHLAQALFDLADAEYEAGQLSRSLQHIDLLLERRADSRQVPGALMLRADILEEQPGTPRHELAETYRQLEARGGADFAPEAYAGIMRWTDDPAERVAYARRVRQTGGIGADQMDEALWFEALGLRDAGDADGAAAIYETLAANPATEAGAKGAVALGEHWLQAGDTAKAEKVLTDFTDTGTPHQYWLARGFIALADTYEAQGKRYLAVEYLKSLEENYPGDELDIHDMMNRRLKAWK